MLVYAHKACHGERNKNSTATATVSSAGGKTEDKSTTTKTTTPDDKMSCLPHSRILRRTWLRYTISHLRKKALVRVIKVLETQQSEKLIHRHGFKLGF